MNWRCLATYVKSWCRKCLVTTLEVTTSFDGEYISPRRTRSPRRRSTRQKTIRTVCKKKKIYPTNITCRETTRSNQRAHWHAIEGQSGIDREAMKNHSTPSGCLVMDVEAAPPKSRAPKPSQAKTASAPPRDAQHHAASLTATTRSYS